MTPKPKHNIIAIVGTTGVGKSQFSIDLARAVNGEIINADSMQVYKDLDNITNKHPLSERHGVPHHVMNHVGWNEEYFIHRFSHEANTAIKDIISRGKVPIVIGGTHYYLQQLLFQNKTVEEKNSLLTEEQRDVLDGPVENLFTTLSSLDPIISKKFHPQDQRKLRRALEIYYTTGQKPSDLYREQKLDELEDSSLKFKTLLFWVYSDPEILKKRLEKRVDAMMEHGAVDEIKQMYQFYLLLPEPKPDFTTGIWQVIGYKEFIPWLEDSCKNEKLFEDGKERMNIRTRQYAKYQVKWIKKLLAVELQKEALFNYKYGGKMYLLDATDLGTWSDKVSGRGIDVAKQFLEGPECVALPQAPEGLEDVLPNDEFFSNFNSNKTLESAKNWKHFECLVCTDKHGKPLVAVGEENWTIHVSSRRHKKQLAYGEKKRKHQEFQMKRKHEEDKKENELKKRDTDTTETETL